MNFAVLHFEKGAGNDAPISSHIERTVSPTNADKERTYLNRELVEFPDGVKNRTEAIQHRIEHAGITRKISHNQVRTIRVMMSGSHDAMQRIQYEGRLDDWCRKSLEWLRKEMGKENVVSAVLHLDEKTPHIHATVVPVVTGERRKVKTEKPVAGKKQYKKKNPNTARLCADDIMARDKFKRFQDTYAMAMEKFGLIRGRDGSEARHITTQQYYRDLIDENEKIRVDNEVLEERKAETYEKVQDLYERKDEARDKFLDMDRHVQDKKEELASVESKLQKAKQDYEPYKVLEELNLIHDLFPVMKEQLRIADLCRKIGLAFESIKALLTGKTLSAKTFTFFSPEHHQTFIAENVKLKMEKEMDNPDKLRLNLNGMNILEWFGMKFQKASKQYSINRKQDTGKSKEIRI